MLSFDGLRIVHVARTFPTSYATMYFADHGADVIRVEEPGYFSRRVAGDGEFYRVLRAMTDRNKRGLEIDLRSSVGLEVFSKLVAQSDVLVEGMRPGVAARLGIDYGKMRVVNEKLIYASLSGYGQEGPLRQTPGHDLNYVGVSGLLHLCKSGPDSAPGPLGVPMADMAGAVQVIVGILTALVARQASGVGQLVDAAMTDAVAAWLILPLAQHLADGINPSLPNALSELSPSRHPYYNVYECSDDRLLTIACNEQWLWKNFCTAINKPDLIDRDGLDRETTRGIVENVMRSRSSGEWIRLLSDADVPVGPVNTLSEALNDPQLRHRGVFQSSVDFPHIVPGPWMHFSQATTRTLPPDRSDVCSILEEFGYSAAEVAELRSCGAVQQAEGEA